MTEPENTPENKDEKAIDVPADSLVNPDAEVPESFDEPTDNHEPGAAINEPPVDPDAVPGIEEIINHNPQDPINNAPSAHAANPGGDMPEELHPVTDDDYVNQLGEEHAEQVVEKAGRPAGFNEYYHGDHLAKPENELIYHAPSDVYDLNKNRENR